MACGPPGLSYHEHLIKPKAKPGVGEAQVPFGSVRCFSEAALIVVAVGTSTSTICLLILEVALIPVAVSSCCDFRPLVLEATTALIVIVTSRILNTFLLDL